MINKNLPVGESLAHESAVKHVSGQAPYVDDIGTADNTMHVAFVLSKQACGRIKNIDLSRAQQASGFKDVLLADDIDHLLIGPVMCDEPLLAKDEVLFYGQALCAVLADSHHNAYKIAALIEVEIEATKAIVSVDDALEQKSFLEEPIEFSTGDANHAIKVSKHQLNGTFYMGGQEHYYLESQAALAIANEAGEMVVHSSTQNPSEVQHLVAEVLGVGQHQVEVITRRMGGGFGGKETDSSQLACICALFAQKYGGMVKARLPRHQDFLMTGKRHDYRVDYAVGFDEAGMVSGLTIDFAARCGYSLDLSRAIVYRTLFHADNAYYFANAHFMGRLCKTNTVSNTAFRGFGGPQGMLAIENILQEIAQYLTIDALSVRQRNFYQHQTRNTTPYGQTIDDNIIDSLTDELIKSSDYHQRRKQIMAFNASNDYLKKGLAFSPVKFGISFTTTFLNQAGALVHIYKDGSIYLNHGGTEMGQGLFIKVAQVLAAEFGVNINRVKSSATSTAKVPNTSATAASAGSDLNGMAAKQAAINIKRNLTNFAVEHFGINQNDIAFANDSVHLANQTMPFAEFISLAYYNRVALSASGFYKTPKIHFDLATNKGRPFFYYAYGVCVSEVLVDSLTGEYQVLAADILHDVGHSLNPAIDRGQIVGGFVQGMGWLCSEELSWSDKGALTTTGASTYKIPAISDIPKRFNVNIKANIANREETIYRSKAVGEPPLMLAISVWLALKDAVFNATGKRNKLTAPATVERVFFALHANKKEKIKNDD